MSDARARGSPRRDTRARCACRTFPSSPGLPRDRDVGPRRLHHLLDAHELYARAAQRLAALPLGEVDRLPALIGDEVGGAFGEQVGDRRPISGQLRGGDAPGLRVGDQVVDRLLRVLLVGADHARRAAFDPADGVVAREVVARGGVDDPPALVRDYAAALVERNPFEPDALVADRAQDEPAFDRLALPRVASADRSGFVNAAWAGPRRPRTTISRTPHSASGSIAWSAVSVASSSGRVSASIRVTSVATLPLPITTARSHERSNSCSAKSGCALYQATNAVAACDPGRSSPGIPRWRSVGVPYAYTTAWYRSASSAALRSRPSSTLPKNRNPSRAAVFS